MKRWISILLCLAMMLSAFGALAAPTYSLPEKMEKQLSIDNGLKGSFILHAEGSHPVLLALQPFLDTELQFRYIKNGERSHGYLYQAGEGETQRGLTEIYLDGSNTFFRTDMLPGEVYRVPATEDLADLLMPTGGGENPSLGSALLRWFRLDSAERSRLLEPVTAWLEEALEMWAASYASLSDTRTLENGTTGFDLEYTIPMAEVRAETVRLLESLIHSEAGQALFSSLLNPEQMETYANPNLGYYYLDALKALNNNYDVEYTRTVSVLGNPVSSVLELPLDEERTHFQTLIMEERGGVTTWTLRGEERIISLVMGSWPDWQEADAFSVWIMSRPGPSAEESEEKAGFHALRVDIAHDSQVSSDEDGRDHLRDSWTVSLNRDVSRLPEGQNASDYPEEEPAEFSLNLHYFSRYAQSSPTTLEADISWQGRGMTLSLKGQMKTASPWVFSPFETAGAADFSALSASELTLKLAEFLAAAGEQIVSVPEIEEAAPEESGEESPIAEPVAEEAETGTETGSNSTEEAEEEVPEANPATTDTETEPYSTEEAEEVPEADSSATGIEQQEETAGEKPTADENREETESVSAETAAETDAEQTETQPSAD